jgi:hypothetical protein
MAQATSSAHPDNPIPAMPTVAPSGISRAASAADINFAIVHLQALLNTFVELVQCECSTRSAPLQAPLVIISCNGLFDIIIKRSHANWLTDLLQYIFNRMLTFDNIFAD